MSRVHGHRRALAGPDTHGGKVSDQPSFLPLPPSEAWNRTLRLRKLGSKLLTDSVPVSD